MHLPAHLLIGVPIQPALLMLPLTVAAIQAHRVSGVQGRGGPILAACVLSAAFATEALARSYPRYVVPADLALLAAGVVALQRYTALCRAWTPPAAYALTPIAVAFAASTVACAAVSASSASGVVFMVFCAPSTSRRLASALLPAWIAVAFLSAVILPSWMTGSIGVIAAASTAMRSAGGAGADGSAVPEQ